ncbi:tRNA a64-2 -o-ribosylphosphate transferase [Stagonosporopsis vannaccii]|nr:tRNA a64-2 -o-ribosylphosphate transferase [Stagonosporopsis vannaccii]
MSQPLTESDIIFPHLSNTPNFSSTLSSLKRSALSITNRLNSISKDSDFVSSVAASYDLPLVANERCGSWYIPLDLKAASVYFKSTDGHMGEWAFSLRRLNLQLLDVVSQHGGCVIVDSTRRGKSMPDALSKTVPFWCCVMNRAIFGIEKKETEALGLFTPPAAVSESENAQMERRVNGFVQQFLDICRPDIASLRSKLQKPLRPLWVTQTSSLPETPPEFPDFHPIILCTASRRVRGAEASEGGYIQGAADDHEAWSHGLTPSLFWSHKDSLLHTNEEDLPARIAELVSQDRGADAIPTLIKPTTTLFVSASQNIDLAPFDTVISCTPEPLSHASLRDAGVKAYLHLRCQSGKLGSRDLRTQLPALQHLSHAPTSAAPKTLICCPTGKDLAVGTAVAYLCLFGDDAGAVDVRSARAARRVDKTLIKQRLSWITTSNPALNPSRATLQSVNSVLMSAPAPAPGAVGPQVRDPGLCDANWALVASVAPPPPPTEAMRALKVAHGADDAAERTSPQHTLFTRLSGTWTFSRRLSSTLPSLPSGTVKGTACFTPHTGLPATLVYSEEGTFRTEGGAEFGVRKGYLYRLCTTTTRAGLSRSGVDREAAGGREAVESGEKDEDAQATTATGEEDAQHIAVHFLDDNASTATSDPALGGLFVEMDAPSLNPQTAVYEARNRESHLCGEDVYAASWEFSGAMLGDGSGGGTREGKGKESKESEEKDKESEKESEWWEVRYEVQGPRKGYVSVTRYQRLE